MTVVRILSLYKVNMEDKILTIQTDSSIAVGDSNIRVAFYTAIGFFVEMAQMLEFNLRKLICYHKSVLEIEEGEIAKDRVESICSEYDAFDSIKDGSPRYVMSLDKIDTSHNGVTHINIEDFLLGRADLQLS